MIFMQEKLKYQKKELIDHLNHGVTYLKFFCKMLLDLNKNTILNFKKIKDFDSFHNDLNDEK